MYCYKVEATTIVIQSVHVLHLVQCTMYTIVYIVYPVIHIVHPVIHYAHLACIFINTASSLFTLCTHCIKNCIARYTSYKYCILSRYCMYILHCTSYIVHCTLYNVYRHIMSLLTELLGIALHHILYWYSYLFVD